MPKRQPTGLRRSTRPGQAIHVVSGSGHEACEAIKTPLRRARPQDPAAIGLTKLRCGRPSIPSAPCSTATTRQVRSGQCLARSAPAGSDRLRLLKGSEFVELFGKVAGEMVERQASAGKCAFLAHTSTTCGLMLSSPTRDPQRILGALDPENQRRLMARCCFDRSSSESVPCAWPRLSPWVLTRAEELTSQRLASLGVPGGSQQKLPHSAWRLWARGS